MPKLKGKTQLASAQEPTEGGTYKIVNVEEVKTSVQGFNGIRVVLQSTKPGEENTQYATMLWMREVAGQKSKLGAFLDAFTDFLGDAESALDTDNWIGHIIRLVSWQPRNREIRVIQ